MNQFNNDYALQLFRRISESDVKAFDELFRAYYAPLVLFCCRYVKDESTASDIVQDSFIKIWQNRDALDHVAMVKSYIYRMVRNFSLNHIRDHSNTHTGLELLENGMELMAEDQSDWQHSAYEELESAEYRLGLVRLWICQLPERQREAFELSRFEGLDHQEIAEVMDVSARTVNNHIVEALKNIQRIRDVHASNNNKTAHGTIKSE